MSGEKVTFFEKGEDGLIREYHMVTGEVLRILGPDSWASRVPEELVKVPGPDGMDILVQKNINLEEKHIFRKRVQFTDMLADLICQQVSNGDSLKTVLSKMNIPYALGTGWRRKFPEFNDALNQAYQDRADYLADRALEEAEEATPTVAGVAHAKLITETLWKSAEVANGKKYSPKQKFEGNINIPMQITIETGIRRSEDPGFLVDETAKLRLKEPVPSLEAGKELVKVRSEETVVTFEDKTHAD